jgi:hypothetical protein
MISQLAIAFVVASTGHTFVTNRPAAPSRGTRVHTIPGAFATSTAATRANTCSWPRSSISCGSLIPGLLPRVKAGCPGAFRSQKILTGVLEATMQDPYGQAPAPG